jgi:hypothetical protein
MPNLSALIAGRSEELSKEYFELAKASQTDDTLLAKLAEYDPDMVDQCVFGIVIDTDDLAVPFGLREAGLRAKTVDGELDFDTLDLAIEYRLRGLDVMLEIVDIEAIEDMSNLISVAASTKISLSFLPPEDKSDEAFERYCLRIEEATKAYLNQPNMLQFVLPVSSYLEYMFLEILNPDRAKTFTPNDEYVIRVYHSEMTVERSDAMKARIRVLIHEHFGDEDGFKEFALDLVGAICQTVDTSVAAFAPPKVKAKPVRKPRAKKTPATGEAPTKTSAKKPAKKKPAGSKKSAE